MLFKSYLHEVSSRSLHCLTVTFFYSLHKVLNLVWIWPVCYDINYSRSEMWLLRYVTPRLCWYNVVVVFCVWRKLSHWLIRLLVCPSDRPSVCPYLCVSTAKCNSVTAGLIVLKVSSNYYLSCIVWCADHVKVSIRLNFSISFSVLRNLSTF